MEEVRGARKKVDLRCHLEGSPPKQGFGQGWGKAEMSSCHDDLYGFVDAFLLRMKKKREIEYARNPIGEPGHA